MNLEYNTQRKPIILKEYGRNVQKLLHYIRSESDKNKRTDMITSLIDLIRQVSYGAKKTTETHQQIWDNLCIIADFDLDVNNPYPMPDREVLFKKPKMMEYPQGKIRFKRYGKNIENLVKKVLEIEDENEREKATIYLGRVMKTFYDTWNKNAISDVVILKDIKEMSGNKLTLNPEKVEEERLFTKLYHERKKPHQQNQHFWKEKRRSGGFMRKKN